MVELVLCLGLGYYGGYCLSFTTTVPLFAHPATYLKRTLQSSGLRLKSTLSRSVMTVYEGKYKYNVTMQPTSLVA